MRFSFKQISDYENNKVHMNDEMIIRFAIFLKVSSDVILGLKSVEIPNESVNTRFTKRLIFFYLSLSAGFCAQFY